MKVSWFEGPLNLHLTQRNMFKPSETFAKVVRRCLKILKTFIHSRAVFGGGPLNPRDIWPGEALTLYRQSEFDPLYFYSWGLLLSSLLHDKDRTSQPARIDRGRLHFTPGAYIMTIGATSEKSNLYYHHNILGTTFEPSTCHPKVWQSAFESLEALCIFQGCRAYTCHTYNHTVKKGFIGIPSVVHSTCLLLHFSIMCLEEYMVEILPNNLGSTKQISSRSTLFRGGWPWHHPLSTLFFISLRRKTYRRAPHGFGQQFWSRWVAIVMRIKGLWTHSTQIRAIARKYSSARFPAPNASVHWLEISRQLGKWRGYDD